MTDQKPNADVTTRRHLLKIGAMAAPAVITLAPASARAQASVLHCFVPFPAKVDSSGKECTGSESSASSTEWEYNKHPNSPGGGQKVGHNKKGQEEEQAQAACYPSPTSNGLTGLHAERIKNGFGMDGISDDKQRYDAYVAYLDNVKRNELQGISCLLSIDMSRT